MEHVLAVSRRAPCASLTEPRGANARHRLLDMVVMALCAVLCGAEGWEESEEDGHAQAEWFHQVLDMPPGMPSPETLRRVRARLAPDACTPCFLTWTQALSYASAGPRAAEGRCHIQCEHGDAPTLRAVGPEGWHRDDRCQGLSKGHGPHPTQQDADDVLALTEHHPTLSEDVTLFRHDAPAHNVGQVQYQCEETVDAEHGRLEMRTDWMTSDLEWRGAKASWSHVHSISMVESRREMGDQVAVATRYAWTSLPCDAAQCAKAVREQWGMENALPGVLDMSLRADDGRMRQEKGAQNLAVLRHIALHLWQRDSRHKRGLKARRKRAGWDRQYLRQVLMG